MIQIIPDFITSQEEQDLLSHIKPSLVTAGTQRNSIIRYGSSLPYNAPIHGLIPNWLVDICIRVKQVGGSPYGLPDSVTINEYHKGQSIDWHIDSPTSGPVISVLSLKTEVEMGLKDPEGKESKVILPPRSLVLLSEDERWKWKHCTYPVPDQRFSIVFRKGTKEEK